MRTTTSPTILLVEKSPDESRDFIDAVQKLDSKITVILQENSFEAIQYLQNSIAQVLVIEEEAHPMNALQTSNYLRQELKLDIPIYISTFKKQEHPYKLSKPYTTESLQFLVNLLTEKCLEDHSLYSLDYLKEISGGNLEFIEESIEIFKSSAKKQLEQLEIAGRENDHDSASKIAHNIKPSFEMLKNKEGAEICNTLTYDLDNHELSTLVTRLKIIFEKIVLQLKKDL